ncbi:MAG: hypothetical protein QXW22_01865 [Candidatus Nanoarchaeia archaeon]|nr:hypothetical protein [Candidatus Haiyanarchaeum thermophilum]
MISVIIALINLGLYISSLGRSSDIRVQMISSIEKVEKQRRMIEQERRHKLELALLAAGTNVFANITGCDKVFLLPREYFPYIPFDQIYYWKYYIGDCIKKFGKKVGDPEYDPICDANGDGVINADDLLIYLERCRVKFGKAVGDPEYDPICDANGDGVIDIRDIVAYIHKYPIVCFPTEEELLRKVESLSIFVGLSKVDELIGKRPEFSIVSQNLVNLTKVSEDSNSIIYEGELKRVYLENDYIIRMIYPKAEGTINISVINKNDPTTRYETFLHGSQIIEGLPLLFQEIKSRDFFVLDELCEGNKSKNIIIQTSTGPKRIFLKSVWNKNSREFEFYINLNPSSACDAPRKLNVGEEIPEIERKVINFDKRSGVVIEFETTQYKSLNIILEGYIYFVPQLQEVKFPKVKIGGESERGSITYSFVPADNEILCYTGGALISGFSFQNCVSIATTITLRGFTDLYSYAKEYLFGNYSGIQGWQEFELDRALRSRWDAFLLKTLKVKDSSGVWIPGEDWKIRLIRNLGCPSDIDCESMISSCTQTIQNYDGLSVRIWNCGSCASCFDALNVSLRHAFLNEFENISVSLLESSTPIRWRIKVKEVDVKIKEICSGETFSTSLIQSEEFKRSNLIMKIGIPMQFLFASSNKLNFTHPKEEAVNPICICNQQEQNRIGDRCLTDEAGTCACKSIQSQMLENYKKSGALDGSTYHNLSLFREALNSIIQSGMVLECNRNSYCCPLEYQESVVLKYSSFLGQPPRETIYPCCKLINISPCENSWRNLTYSCLSQDETGSKPIHQHTVVVKEECV